MAHKKGQGATRNGRDSNAQYRGIKVFGGERVKAGSILVRQVGSTFHAGRNVGTGKDYTLWARIDGYVRYEREGKKRKRISVYSELPEPATDTETQTN
jgi:large subunit ribosomal protein L27